MSDRPLRPLVLLSHLATAGAERVTVSFVRRLRAMGIEATVCTLTTSWDGLLAAELEASGVRRYDLGARRLADPRALLRLHRLLARERPDLVHAHGQDAAILAAAARRLRPFPLVITRHVMEDAMASLRQRLRARAGWAALRRADAAVAVSRAVAGRLAELSGLPREAIHVITNGVELERFAADVASSRLELRAAFGAGPEDRLVLVPAALRPGKGHDVLLDALPALRARAPGVRLLFAGGGDQEAALRARAGALGDGRGSCDAVLFLGPRSDIPDLLAACDLVVLPSEAEALPTALIEAAASGRPAVATRVGGIPEVVADGVTGLLVRPNDPAALFEAMVALLLDGERARSYGIAARWLARQHFAIEKQVERTLTLWDSIRPRGHG